MNEIKNVLFLVICFIMASIGLSIILATNTAPIIINNNEERISNIKQFNVQDYGAIPDGKSLCTVSIQAAIDKACVEGGGVVDFPPGVYLTGSIFLKSNVELRINEGVELRGVADETAYPDMWSRVAGIEMEWPSGLINICGQKNVKITGTGIINGQGEYWWNKYWGKDKHGGMRKEYEAKNLRWALDYDCKRPRNIMVLNSSNVTLENITSIRSPFWNVHICYSEHIHISGLTVKDNKGPSTDGIDIDSSSDVLVEDCFVECNDDNFCIKSGRDADGLRVNKAAENIVIRNCETGSGEGITIGSETSGGVRNVEIYNIKAHGTKNGLRLKSAATRGGLVEKIYFHDIEMEDVPHPFSFLLNWYPLYSYAKIPENWEMEIPKHWYTLTLPVDREQGIPEFRDIKIENVKVNSLGLSLDRRRLKSKAFEVEAFPEKPIGKIYFKNITIEAEEAGTITNAKDWRMENVKIKTANHRNLILKNCEKCSITRF